MSLERVKTYLAQYGLQHRVTEHDVSSATVELAAAAIGCKPEEIAKTLAFLDKEGTGFVVVTDGSAKVDNRKFKDTFQLKAKMCPPAELIDKIGHEMGGVCPFALVEGVSIYFDRSLRKHDKLYPACGTVNSSMELTLEELETICPNHTWVDVTK